MNKPDLFKVLTLVLHFIPPEYNFNGLYPDGPVCTHAPVLLVRYQLVEVPGLHIFRQQFQADDGAEAALFFRRRKGPVMLLRFRLASVTSYLVWVQVVPGPLPEFFSSRASLSMERSVEASLTKPSK